MIQVRLKKSKEKAVLQRHPWLFSGAIDAVSGKAQEGEIVKVVDKDDDFLAYGYYNSKSRVAVRLLEWDETVVVDEQWWRSKIQHAIEARQHLLTADNNTCRLIFSESDYLPGLIVDIYGDYLSLQILTVGIDKVKNIVIDTLRELTGAKGIVDKSDNSSRAHDGLAPSNGGMLWGEEPDTFIEVKENGVKYWINVLEGQKSGFYCDQRENRKVLASYVKGKQVLDCFSYSGGFSLNSLLQGASKVTSVDSSALAIETLKKNIQLNQFEASRSEAIQSDVNKQLRTFKEEGQHFDVVVLDPPKYAPSRSALDKAARAYKDLNRLGMQILEKGGLLATFSCSGAMDIDTFKQVIAWAALDAGKEVQILYQFCQPEDHPVRISFNEGEYLKGLLCRVY